MEFIRTNPSHPKFQKLVQQLDAELNDMYGLQMEFFGPLNILKLDTFSLVAIQDDEPVGIGAFKISENPTEVEIKRMFVPLAHRGKGISKLILQELESWAKENQHTFAKLETGEKNIAAQFLYKKAGYAPIEQFGPYVGRENSFCFGKKLI